MDDQVPLIGKLPRCFTIPFREASAAPESLESSLTDDYMGVHHYAALGIGFPSSVGTSPPPFCFNFFYFILKYW